MTQPGEGIPPQPITDQVPWDTSAQSDLAGQAAEQRPLTIRVSEHLCRDAGAGERQNPQQ